MASHHVTIAKASFAAGLLKPDLTVVNRDGIALFHRLLENVIASCSPSHIEKCKDWLLQNVVVSANRTAALGKYLVSLSKHISHSVGVEQSRGKRPRMSEERKRLHLLYLLHDLLHHVKYHLSAAARFTSFGLSLQPFLPELVQMAVSQRRPRVSRRLQNFCDIWKEEGFYEPAFTQQLFEPATHAPRSDDSTPITKILKPEDALVKDGKDLPYMMPTSHGDPATPFYDLPAGNFMPHIIPNSPSPINPDHVRALQFAPGPAEDGLVQALKEFLKDIGRITESDVDTDTRMTVLDVDDLGHTSYRDETGEIQPGTSYYGWSQEFCEKMKRRRDEEGHRSSRSREHSSASSRGRSPRKRRRYSHADSRSLSRSDSQSPGARRGRGRDDQQVSSQNGERGRHRRSISRSASSGYSPPMPDSSLDPAASLSHAEWPNERVHLPPPTLPLLGSPFGVPPSGLPFQVPPLGPNGLPIPPPRPPNYMGVWPPPPPPPPHPGMVFPLGIPMPSSLPLQPGSTFPPPPPVPGHPPRRYG